MEIFHASINVYKVYIYFQGFKQDSVCFLISFYSQGRGHLASNLFLAVFSANPPPASENFGRILSDFENQLVTKLFIFSDMTKWFSKSDQMLSDYRGSTEDTAKSDLIWDEPFPTLSYLRIFESSMNWNIQTINKLSVD